MSNKLIISDFYKDILFGFFFKEDRLERLIHFNEDNVLGNVYSGYVKDVVKNINGAFVYFDNNKVGFLSLKGFEESVKQGDKVLVQVAGDKIKSKDYSLTTAINLNSECLVLTAKNTDISISKKIKDTTVRKNLKDLLAPLKNHEYGFIIRTNAVSFSNENILKQAYELIKKWTDIKKKFDYSISKSILLKKNQYFETINDLKKNGVLEIITDNLSVYEKLNEKNISCTYNSIDKISLCNKYSLETNLNKLISKKVWLKSGAYLVIEPTEALTVIDVNTGKADLKTNRESTFKKINLEAAKEAASQIKLRNISGIIIVDFINMKNSEDYDILNKYMSDCLLNDFSVSSVVDITKLGLMEITRKKKEKSLNEIISEIN